MKYDRRASTVEESNMVEITIEEISENLPVYLQRVQAGESFFVLQAGTPVAQVVPPRPGVRSSRGKDFLESLAKFREQRLAEDIDLNPDEIFKDVRDCTPAPEEPRW
jgi:cellobiose PTS system EIIB component